MPLSSSAVIRRLRTCSPAQKQRFILLRDFFPAVFLMNPVFRELAILLSLILAERIRFFKQFLQGSCSFVQYRAASSPTSRLKPTSSSRLTSVLPGLPEGTDWYRLLHVRADSHRPAPDLFQQLLVINGTGKHHSGILSQMKLFLQHTAEFRIHCRYDA